ncbi:AAA family ATPase [Synechocystis salina]|uniref:AAA family ATPase n=1 Tax=Synechocystis salina LEGE 00031 TaxID=1828736 RepID=A0ABR9VUG2_9SYNC|nr:AAA family ATPase [Synechocystis salina]MBE9241696.1 AAA family ATPase [Synechocystis salina LEGE 00041]MBE9255000.1 AAA family ATPase [Synechocystis salina LEGE 00031]
MLPLAKKKFSDIAIGQQIGHSPFFKLTSGGDTHSLSGNSLSLLEFSDADSKFCYVEKVGQIDSQNYSEKLKGRFESVKSWQENEPFHKVVTGDEKQIEAFFQNGAVCFFPSSRHERPHWLNLSAVGDQPIFGNDRRMSGVLGKPLIVERAAEDNRQWLMDVFLDSLVDGDFVIGPITPEGRQFHWQAKSNIQDKWWFKAGRQNIERLIRAILEDEKTELILNYRNAVHGRVSIRLGNGVIIPSLNHLSAGQALLFNLFATIIRYADRTDLQKSINLSEIKGIVLIDEIDAHLHTDLQYEVLPKLVKLFPKVQFIITSHAPLFLLGMEREFGSNGIQILEMPTGKKISTERFEEFLKSFEYYCQTQIFENSVEEQVLRASKPLVLTEGWTDVTYLKTALELLGHSDLLEQLEIDEVGKSGREGSKGGGHTNLDAARKFLENNQSRFPRRVLLLYDCDTGKKAEDVGSLLSRCIPQNSDNTKVIKGIENLLPSELFEDRFYQKRNKPTDYGGENIISEFSKNQFCEWVCMQRRNRNDFLQFEVLVVPILQEFLSPKVCKVDDEPS